MVAVCVAASLWVGIRVMLPHTAIDTTGVTATIGGYLCRESEFAEVVMLSAMAAMFAYPGAPVVIWRVVFAGIGVALIVRLVATRSRHDGLPGQRVAATCYHAFAAVAMLYATLGHSGHSAAAHNGGLGGPLASVLGWIFVIAFAVDIVVVAGVAGAAPARYTMSRPHLVAALLPHGIMDVAMIVMLYAAVTHGPGH